MKSLKILSLSNNLLRGSMPEKLISKLGATNVQKFIMPGNRLADVDTVSCSVSFCRTTMACHHVEYLYRQMFDLFALQLISCVYFTRSQAMLLLRRPLQCSADRGLLIFSLVAAYVDLGSDVGAAVTFYLGDKGVIDNVFVVVVVVVVVLHDRVDGRGVDVRSVTIVLLGLSPLWPTRDPRASSLLSSPLIVLFDSVFAQVQTCYRLSSPSFS